MDSSEEVAYEFLRRRFPNETVCYEPDGNRMPDFLVSQRVAVEVRRLNQNVYVDSNYLGLEELSKPVDDMLRRLLKEFGPSDGDKSWHVSFTMSPQHVRRDPGIKKKVRRLLKQFLNNADRREGREGSLPLCDFSDSCFCLDLHRSSKSFHQLFVFIPLMDWRRNGFILPKLSSNIPICVMEKTKKLKKSGAMNKYAEWWLVLVNRIDWGLGDGEVERLRLSICVPPEWTRIVVLDPRTGGVQLELRHDDEAVGSDCSPARRRSC